MFYTTFFKHVWAQVFFCTPTYILTTSWLGNMHINIIAKMIKEFVHAVTIN